MAPIYYEACDTVTVGVIYAKLAAVPLCQSHCWFLLLCTYSTSSFFYSSCWSFLAGDDFKINYVIYFNVTFSKEIYSIHELKVLRTHTTTQAATTCNFVQFLCNFCIINLHLQNHQQNLHFHYSCLGCSNSGKSCLESVRGRGRGGEGAGGEGAGGEGAGDRYNTIMYLSNWLILRFFF